MSLESRENLIKDETNHNEIAFLRNMSKKELKVELVDFTEKMKQYDPSQAEIWCVIGNPGSGKTFLCRMIAFRFSKGQLPQINYSIYIPCLTPNWHDMERSRIDSKLPINAEFIQQWLCLGMPIGPSWTSDLAEHLIQSDGQDLLLIIDGLDEFTRVVPFQQSLLYLLLTREVLSQSTILLTSRPGAYAEIQSSHPLRIDVHYKVLGFSPENRDLYFRLQIKDKKKLTELRRLLYLHEEVSELSLIPANASLFTTLARTTDDITAHSLTELYTQLTTCLIKRQLSRMRLKRLAEKRNLFQLDSTVLDCLYRIGEVAYQGLQARDRIFSKDILLKRDKAELSCNYLGVAKEHIRKDKSGGLYRVWSFQHLINPTMVSRCNLVNYVVEK